MSDITADSPVLLEIVDRHIAIVTLNREDARNAVNGALAAAMEAQLEAIEADDAIRVCILAAHGDKSFCAGADLKEVVAGRGHMLVTARGGFAGFVDAPRSKPWIAAVTADALGGGLELALTCDLIVCATEARLGLPEVKRGLVALAGGVWRLPRAIPRAIAIEMMTTGRPIDAARAFSLGLVNSVVPRDQVLAQALELAREIAGNGLLAVRETLQLARASDDADADELRQRSRDTAMRILRSEDVKIGARAFIQKIKPEWTGR